MWKDRQNKIDNVELLGKLLVVILSIVFWVFLFWWNKTWGLIIFLACLLIGLIISILKKSFERDNMKGS